MTSRYDVRPGTRSIERAAKTLALALVVIAPCARAGAADDALIERVRAAHAGIRTLEATFEQVNDWSLHEPEARYRGHLVATRDGRVRIEYIEPPGHLFVSDGVSQWTYVPETGQAIESAAGPTGAPIARLFLDFLAGRSVRDVTREGATARLRIDPGAELPLASLEVVVDATTGLGERFAWTDLEGNTAHYRFLDSRTNVAIDDSAFGFRPPEGVEVIRMTEVRRGG